MPVTDTWQRAAGIGVPVLALNGSLESPDHLGMAERLIRAVPEGRTATVERAAHYPGMENPAAYNAHLRTFLEQVTG
ncbi:alpha/beta hydrolase [Streptomyces diacarni]|uniref:alpha/beta fold hydrolase n=1 Tax=Streptomyces diacarni TaxID=2800381 RepID=UPI0033E46084